MDSKALYETTAMLAGQLRGIPLTVFADMVDRLTREQSQYPGTAATVLPALPEMYRDAFVQYLKVLRSARQSGAGARRWLRDAGWVNR